MTAEQRQRRETRFCGRRHVGRERSAFVAGDGDKPQLPCLCRPDQRRERQEGKVDAALGEIGQGGEGIAIGDVGELEPGRFQERGEGEVGHAGRAGQGEGAGAGARRRDDLRQRRGAETGRGGERDEILHHEGERDQIADGIEGEVFVDQLQRRPHAGAD